MGALIEDPADEYEVACNEVIRKNNEYLEIFEQDLIAQGLSEKTIYKHLSNVDFYINVYLLRYEPLTVEHGTDNVGGFLGDFFIRKCLWSSPNSIKETAASFKKFYKCMVKHGIVEEDDYAFMCDEIKSEMKNWQQEYIDFRSIGLYGFDEYEEA